MTTVANASPPGCQTLAQGLHGNVHHARVDVLDNTPSEALAARLAGKVWFQWTTGHTTALSLLTLWAEGRDTGGFPRPERRVLVPRGEIQPPNSSSGPRK